MVHHWPGSLTCHVPPIPTDAPQNWMEVCELLFPPLQQHIPLIGVNGQPLQVGKNSVDNSQHPAIHGHHNIMPSCVPYTEIPHSEAICVLY